jgi:hypothetical protein
MRIGFLNEVMKKLMVALLVRTDRQYPLKRERIIEFLDEKIEVSDLYIRSGILKLAELYYDGKFNAIHMASSRYFTGNRKTPPMKALDHLKVNETGTLRVHQTIDLTRGEN